MIPETRKKKKQKKKKQAPVTVVAFACYVSANCAVLVGRTGPGFVSQIRHNVEFTFTGICPDSTALPHALFLKQGPN